MKLVKQLFLLIAITAILSSCKNDDPAPDTTPVIESFSPEQGAPGATVTINGKNFSETILDNHLTFAETQAAIISASPTQLTAIVPHGASTGKIKLELHNTTATSGHDFTVTSSTSPTPLITSFAPSSGPVGSTVSIYGSNFSPTPSENIVTIGDVTAGVVSASATQVIITVPANAVSGKIVVRVNNVNGISSDAFTITITPPVLVISSFTPTQGKAGTTVTITGVNFGGAPSDNIVKLGDAQVQVQSASATELVITIPDGAASGRFTVTAHGVTRSSDDLFIVIPPPVIDTFFPAGGLFGSSVSIFGTRFSTTGGNTVKFGDIEAEITEATSSKITAKIPDGVTTGKISLTVDGTTVSTATDFVIIFRPVVTTISPTEGPPGIRVTITGDHFLSSVFGQTFVVFFSNTQPTFIESISDTEIIVRAPPLDPNGPNGQNEGPITVIANNMFAISPQSFHLLP